MKPNPRAAAAVLAAALGATAVLMIAAGHWLLAIFPAALACVWIPDVTRDYDA